MQGRFNPSDTVRSARFVQARVSKQLESFYHKPYAVVSAELLATVLAVILLGAFAIRPTLVTMSQLIKDIQDRRETLEVLQKKVAALSSLSAELPTVRNEVQALHRALPDSADLDGALRRIEYLASQRAVFIESLSVSELPEEKEAVSVDDGVTSFGVIVSFSSTYEASVGLIQDLLRMDRAVEIDSITMQSPKNEQIAGQVQTSLQLRCMYRGVNKNDTTKKTTSTKEEPTL